MFEIFQKMDILRIFRMQEPVSKELLSKNTELGQYKEVVQEKDVLIKNNKAKIKELENEITELKLKNEALEARLKTGNLDENGFQSVMVKYDEFLNQVWTERQDLIDKNTILDTYVKNLESSFNELLEKFGKAKVVIEGLIENQDVLKNELKEYQKVIETLENKYKCLKVHSESKIAEANEEIENKEKGNVQEVAKLKAKILQSQAKINELEKHVKFEDIRPKQSMFAPLKSNLSKV
ncbi:transforming acidic coiled-coil-containing protein 3 [Leptinotarsa decemlineata]|uniref:transforming acidic coiled-coil-containing protein 3 n=1 Tax=Leptinotarsa decemlineata TaxID=7539 RepID=UPI000C251859|nr:transforming acidic coiled-coil-containing protein 3-like [Leptinotarsa decemlineata]